MNRTSHNPPWRIIWLVGIAGLIAGGEARAESHEAAHKHSFAGLLARRTKLVRNAGSTVGAASVVASRHVSRRADLREQRSASHSDGLAAASPLVPSGHGAGRDGFVEAMYEETFGREAKQRELDHLTRMLAFGMRPQTLASILWNSPEHRALRRAGLAPRIPFERAYQKAMVNGRRARRAR